MQFGQVFRERRESLGLTLEHIEEETKIRKLYLDAIEKERLISCRQGCMLPGLLESMRYLNLDDQLMVAWFVEDSLWS